MRGLLVMVLPASIGGRVDGPRVAIWSGFAPGGLVEGDRAAYSSDGITVFIGGIRGNGSVACQTGVLVVCSAASRLVDDILGCFRCRE